MPMYLLYRIGYFLTSILPLNAAYRFADLVADLLCAASPSNKRAIVANMKTITAGRFTEPELKRMARNVYRNFARYLVDFFRSSKIDDAYLKKYVKVDGRENIKKALDAGRGAILLSAHIGNWELGGSVVGRMGYPISAVVLTHEDEKVNDFFRKQRLAGKMMPIEMGIALKTCFRRLKSNELLAILGDRDFAGSGLRLPFFGKDTLFPKGPAVFAYRIGSAIVPALMVREPDNTYRLTLGSPFFADTSRPEEDEVRLLTAKCASIMEDYVRRYPEQWYIFKDMWKKDE